MTKIDKNIIMCLTTGRSGTNLLEKLLGLAEDTCSLHEPAPYFSDHVMQVRENPDHAIDFVRDEKLPAILAVPENNYAESSHLFGKGFFEAFIKLDIPFKLIILNRGPRTVAKSFWRIGTIPGRTEKGIISTYHPDEAGVLKLKNWQKLSNYQLCYWYALEVERRKAKYAEVCQTHNIPVVETSISQLKNWEKFKSFTAELGLSLPKDASAEHANITAKKVNRKRKYFGKLSFVPLSWQEHQVWKMIDRPDLAKQIKQRYGK